MCCLLAFGGWPLAAACAFGGPEVATVLLLFVAASLAYLSRSAAPAASPAGSAAAVAARSVGTGILIVVALVALSPFVVSLIVLLTREFG